ncbi:MAG: PD40 domain-containing protein [Candidatus Rokubacteria bacterium]|nr:PD40 domain-containing protein [Candidatus Rokubacteria bacterium]
MKRSIATALIVVAACTTPPSGGPDATGAGTRATFVLANNAGLVALDAACKPIGRIVELPSQSAAATPSLSPDRTKMAFALTQPPSKTTGFGSDIFEVKLDGSGFRALVEHEAENVFYASPRYDPTANALYVHKRAAIVRNGQYVGNTDEILRVDLATGQRTTLVSDASDPTISPDGKRMVYVHLKDALPDGLWVVSLPSGGDARPFLATRDTFIYLQTPRFSPSGSDVVFSAAGRQTGATLGGRPAHLGIPSELFLVTGDGTKLSSLGPTGDDVIPAWSPDATKIAYVGVGTFTIMTLADQEATVCAQGEQFFFGDPLWVR